MRGIIRAGGTCAPAVECIGGKIADVLPKFFNTGNNLNGGWLLCKNSNSNCGE